MGWGQVYGVRAVAYHLGMALLQAVKEKKAEIARIADRHGARNVRVFGSVARGEERDDSDIDFLVVMDPDRSLFDQASLLVDLEELLGRGIDVVTEPSLRSRFRERVLAEAVAI